MRRQAGAGDKTGSTAVLLRISLATTHTAPVMKKTFVTRLIAIWLFAVSSVTAGARLTFTERLRKKPAIVLKQDRTIDLLVNGREPDAKTEGNDAATPGNTTVQSGGKTAEKEAKPQSKSANTSPKGVRYVQGYRVKFFTGSGTREGKEEAQLKGREFKRLFPHVSVYMHFVSPHWICTAGDFATQTEAYEFIKEVKEEGSARTSEMIVVKSKVKIYGS